MASKCFILPLQTCRDRGHPGAVPEPRCCVLGDAVAQRGAVVASGRGGAALSRAVTPMGTEQPSLQTGCSNGSDWDVCNWLSFGTVVCATL